MGIRNQSHRLLPVVTLGLKSVARAFIPKVSTCFIKRNGGLNWEE